MSDNPSETKLKQIAKDKPILSPHKQRLLWARVSTIKRLLIAAGMTTHEEFEGSVNAMVRDIDNKVEEGVRRELGAEPEEE